MKECKDEWKVTVAVTVVVHVSPTSRALHYVPTNIYVLRAE